MFSRIELGRITDRNRYRRGELLEQTGGVVDFTIESMGEQAYRVWKLHAFVRGTSKPFHDASLYLDRQSLDLVGSYCDCPDYAHIEGLCKHCAALALHYFANEQQYRRTMEKHTVKPKPRTESGMADLLRKHSQKERLMIAEDPSLGKVRLEPTLHLQKGEPSISLRIGIDRLYVVKDIPALAQRVREMKNYSYGKNLTFVHQLQAFEEKSRRIMELMLRMTENYNYWYYDSGRQLYLGGSALDELMEITAGTGILVVRDGEEPQQYMVSTEPIRQRITVAGKEGGIALQYRLPNKLQSTNYNYYFKDDVIHRQERGNQETEEIEDYLYEQSGGNKGFVAEEDLPLFVRDLLPLIEERYEVRTKGIDLSAYQPEEAQFQVYLDLPQDDMITCDLVAVYSGERVYHVFRGIPEKGNRNVPQEMQMQTLVSGYCNAMDSERGLAVAANDEDGMYRLLTEGIQRFREAAEVYLSDRLRRIAEVQRPNVTVGVSLSGDLLNLKLTSDGMPLDELAAILSRYDRKKKFIRLKGGEFLSMEDENLGTLAQVKRGLMLTDKEMAKGEAAVPKFRALFLDAQLQESEELSVHRSRGFKSLIRQMHTVEDSDYEVPESLSKTLREYQKNGYRWIETLYANGFGGILADDMGLGKTLQVITFLLAHYGQGAGEGAAGTQMTEYCSDAAQTEPAGAKTGARMLPENPEREDGSLRPDSDTEPLRTLIVCPASLVYNWENECRQFAPSLPVFTAAGPAQERKLLLMTLPKRAIVITSYDLLKRDQETYERMNWNYEFIDEAQFIKNAGTKAAQSVKAVPAGFRMALTGTPVENRLSELWSIFDYLMPGYLYSYQKFRKELETPIVSNGDEEAMQRLQKMISPFVLRRLKKDVLKDLPDKIERDMVARMEGEQKELYEAHVQRLKILLDKQTPEEFDRSKIQVLAELTKLRQLCCDPSLLYEGYAGGSAKLDLCMELVDNAVEAGHKLLIFSQFTTMLDLIAARLHERGIGYYMLTGSTPKSERMQMVNDFNDERGETPVFCISLKAGGTGLNLTAADIVIHYDPWWNTAAQNQATDRTHRIGQKNVVNVYKLIAQDSIEDNIVRLQERKQELADQVLGGSDAANPTFNKEELLELLGS